MAEFLYKATNSAGNKFEGSIEAKDKAEAEALLMRRRLIIESLKKKPMEIKINIGSGIKPADISRFTRMFSSMSSAGLPMLQCLNILEEQCENPELKTVIHKVTQSINGGSSLADALTQHPKVFTTLYTNMVAAGEAGGILDGILARLAETLENGERLKRKVKKALTYPVMLIIVGILVVIALMTFVVPTFAAQFAALDAELPAPTQVVMNISDFLRDNGLLLGIFVVILIVAYKLAMKVPKAKYAWDGLMLKIPKLGDLQIKSTTASFARTLGTLLNAGVSVMDSLKVVASTVSNKVVERAIGRISIGIAGGKSIAEPMAECNLFPPMVIQMTGVGEKTGNLGGMLLKLADFYDEEVDAAVDGVVGMMEPLIIVFLGGAVGGLLIAMYMPMFSMSDSVKG
ncbi:type IV pilus assembly protein PilC [Fibrobacter sp. UWH9]|uniref:type II secretion system F family protein n=1 Tax=unclassified Fibrobacter TaxID=2634177 RepID=UPI000923DE98|nr:MULTISPECIES: type II secretion system F family protein [Fibrobacter]MCQ2100748.1 type II secretion system F family protein [Fibrobacter sp.]MCL4102593.1 Type II secretion system protein F [Fibrobacter succinogenes]OWV03405.1 type II secretion protein F [Fibrobacter sp. UWH3]OWV10383.1 type II secretion protein F [Fibrobacter sp. UWH1]SHH87098.1 type IV pilus assembly protein PilC [Fibrobacter sp. UWH9]